MPKPTINPEALKQFAVASNELLNLMRAVNLDGQARSAESKANESSSPDSDSSSEESFITAPNSPEDSFEFSFGSLNITASEWEEIDRESAPLPEEKPKSATTEEKPTSATTTEDGPRKAGQPSTSTTDPLTSSTHSTKKTTPDMKPGEALGEVQIHTKYRFSPSVLAHHANTACEKMLHLKGAELWAESQQPESQQPKHQHTKDNSPGTMAQAHQERGLDFEARLQQKIQKKIDCESQQDNDSFFRLATSEIGTTLCQPIFSLDASFYTPEMTQAGIEFGRFIPDFIRIVAGSKRSDGTRRNRLFIIDAKSSLQVKISHQVMTTGSLFSDFNFIIRQDILIFRFLFSPSSSSSR